MEQIKRAWRWILAKDTSLDADQRLSRWTNLATAASIAVSVIVWAFGWLFSIPWPVGLLSGLVAWVVLLNTVVARGRKEVRKTEATATEKLEQLTTRLREAEQERDELTTENQRLRDRPGDEELKQESSRLSGELFGFAEERDKDDPQHDPNFPVWMPETQEDYDLTDAKTRYDNETRAQYRQRHEGDLRALLGALVRREWCDAEERKEIEGELDAFWRSPSQRMERVAARLDAFAKRM